MSRVPDASIAFEVALSSCDGALSMLPRDTRAAVLSEIVARFPSEAARRTAPELTPMQWRILRLSADGLTVDAIQRTLAMGLRTVNTHRTAIRERLGASTMAHAVHIAHRHGMLS